MPTPDHIKTARILKVNHAGEYGAIRIYRAQLWLARKWYPDLVPFLEETLSHELDHCQKFRAAMPARNARPCRIMTLWGNGGYILGFLTALLGRQGIWICTAAIERAVHRHLEDQLHFLRERDRELYDLILGIQQEELAHLHHAEERIVEAGKWEFVLDRIVTGATEVAIWLSTWGDSSRMVRDINVDTRSANRRR